MQIYQNSLTLFCPNAQDMDEVDSSQSSDSEENELAIREAPFEKVFGYIRMMPVDDLI
jgi:hypothetical protein